MNGDVISIRGINISQQITSMEDSTDVSHVVQFNDGERTIRITFFFGKIIKITDEKNSSNKHQQ